MPNPDDPELTNLDIILATLVVILIGLFLGLVAYGMYTECKGLSDQLYFDCTPE